VVGGLVSVAGLALLYALISRDFGVKYVAGYTSRDLPLFYTVAALWAGQEGSLFLWAWLLAGIAVVVMIQNRRRNRALMPYVTAVLLGTEVFFLTLLVFTSNPFARLAIPPLDGQGMNPLLQNLGMVFHPVTTYLGYVGFTVPFAFAVAALLTGHLDETWIRTTRRWTLFSWLFLSIGIGLGAQWAYVELGWGGYWAWDPVENASLMPCHRLPAFSDHPGTAGDAQGVEFGADHAHLRPDSAGHLHHPQRDHPVGTRLRRLLVGALFPGLPGADRVGLPRPALRALVAVAE